MGMFDYVVCEYPLPGLENPSSIEFQTKDRQCCMDTLKITKEGRLLEEEYRIEDRSDPNATGLLRIAGMLTRIPTGWRDLDFHGWLNFYGDKHSGEFMAISLKESDFGRDLNHPERAEWFEYAAKFTDGNLVHVERIVEAEIEPLTWAAGHSTTQPTETGHAPEPAALHPGLGTPCAELTAERMDEMRSLANDRGVFD